MRCSAAFIVSDTTISALNRYVINFLLSNPFRRRHFVCLAYSSFSYCSGYIVSDAAQAQPFLQCVCVMHRRCSDAHLRRIIANAHSPHREQQQMTSFACTFLDMLFFNGIDSWKPWTLREDAVPHRSGTTHEPWKEEMNSLRRRAKKRADGTIRLMCRIENGTKWIYVNYLKSVFMRRNWSDDAILLRRNAIRRLPTNGTQSLAQSFCHRQQYFFPSHIYTNWFYVTRFEMPACVRCACTRARQNRIKFKRNYHRIVIKTFCEMTRSLQMISAHTMQMVFLCHK